MQKMIPEMKTNTSKITCYESPVGPILSFLQSEVQENDEA